MTRPDRESPPTRAQQRPSPPTRAQHPAPAEGAAGDLAAFPERLAATYTPRELLGTGTEGAVWRVAAGPATLAVKVHWDNQPMDPELIAHLDDPAFHRHAPAIAAHGRLTTSAGTRDWVAMEYLPRNLADLMHPRPDRDAARAIIAELDRLIAFWQHRIQRNPLDFKPANILVRDRGAAPGEFVIADFGGVHRFTASQSHGGASRFNLAYAPPEHTWSENATPWPWWGLGEVVYELATGHARFRRPDGALKSDAEILRSHILDDPAADIDDDRLALLVRGLLTVDPDDRWGHEQVTAWLEGASPPVAQPQRPRATLAFGRLELSDPAEVATTLLQRGTDAARWLTEERGAEKLTAYLAALGDHDYDTALLAGELDSAAAHRAVTALGAHFAPEATPTHRGRTVDTDGLIHLAATDPDHLHALITDPDTLKAVALYHCGHPECRTLPRCDRVQRLIGEAPALADEALRAAADHDRTHPAAPDVAAHDPPHAHALAALAVLDPAALRTQVEQTRAAALLGPHWWRRQVLGTDTADTPHGRQSMVTTLLLADRAEAERGHGEQRQTGRAYARGVGHRTLAGIASGFALVNATWAGMGSFPGTGAVLASVFPLIVAASAAIALWPWRTPEGPSRVLTAASWTCAAVFALAYRRTGLHPPAEAAAWWPMPEWLTAFMGLLPEPFAVFSWWFQLLISAAVVVAAVKLLSLRMRLAYRQRYVRFWDAPRVGEEPEQRAGLAPLLALSWLGLLTTSAVLAALYHGGDLTLRLAAPPAAYLLVFLAAGAGVWWLAAPQRLLVWGGLAAAAVLSAGWFPPLDLVAATEISAPSALLLGLLGLGMTAGSLLYARTRLSPPHTPPAPG